MTGINASAERMGARGQARQEQPAVPRPPKGAQSRLRWLGPGFLWMVSAAGSGELLFSPRIGSLYGYSLLWALLAAVACKWFINREVGRYAVCTGAPILEGFKQLPGPRNWALWLIVVPQEEDRPYLVADSVTRLEEGVFETGLGCGTGKLEGKVDAGSSGCW